MGAREASQSESFPSSKDGVTCLIWALSICGELAVGHRTDAHPRLFASNLPHARKSRVEAWYCDYLSYKDHAAPHIS
jgi:hypothetical protein